MSGIHLLGPLVGGSEGLRRLRELRKGGYEIDRRTDPHSDIDEYRLVREPHERPATLPPPYVAWSSYRDGWKALVRGRRLEVIPDMSGKAWYWSVRPGNIFGRAESATSAKIAALQAIREGV